ncbi:glycosyltransferase [Epilithonimonas zeae]|uniref:Glycosyltransferase involved in cell wall bisynthesis n=1 Tax=Epilithonimonas zeae TaxID=1416779 RepID=A0A1N6HFE1_9FLAO|nr:glycosyltransferase [Epilithonimonas zeae]SIO18325.1 Glycosyltransferase involved in cell wall bisynthesis [Epilithonimonas zeae]
MKVALVQDWLTELGGAEKVFKQILDIYPDADIYTLVYNKEVLKKLDIEETKVTASFIQNFPFSKTKYRNYLPFFTMAIESFDLRGYDLVISSSYCVAKGVLTTSTQKHICYCHSPVRYAWDLHHQYLEEANLKKGLKAFVVKYFLHKLRIWDIASLNRVDQFVSNSNFIKERIKKVYNRDSVTIYPPIEIDEFEYHHTKDDFYITCSRMVPYKKIDLIVSAFSKMPDKKLIVIGTGPDYNKIEKLATSNITLMGYQTFAVLKDHIQRAKAFVFAAEEDFGIVPLEAQAAGTPVIAYRKGGALETVIDEKTGIFFNEQTEESIIEAVQKFEIIGSHFNTKDIRENAEKFSPFSFNDKFTKLLENL